jgi:hypothetical protein
VIATSTDNQFLYQLEFRLILDWSSGKEELRLKHAVANGDDSPVASDPVDPNHFDAILSCGDDRSAWTVHKLGHFSNRTSKDVILEIMIAQTHPTCVSKGVEILT